MHDTGTLGGRGAIGYGINDLGQITGWANATGNYRHAFFYDGTMHDLGTLTTGLQSQGNAINAAGIIAGTSDKNGTFTKHGFRYSNGGMVDLGALSGDYSSAQGINNNNQIVGFSIVSGSPAQQDVFRTTSGGLIDSGSDLGTFAGAGGASAAYAINDLGQVTGYSDDGSGYSHAFRTTVGGLIDGTATNIGSFDGFFSQGRAIDNFGDVVGQSANRAFYYDTALYDLNNYLDASSTGWQLTDATGITDNGYIVGTGVDPAGKRRAFLLVPDATVATTPEPGAVALLMGMSMTGIGFAVRRKRRK